MSRLNQVLNRILFRKFNYKYNLVRTTKEISTLIEKDERHILFIIKNRINEVEFFHYQIRETMFFRSIKIGTNDKLIYV